MGKGISMEHKFCKICKTYPVQKSEMCISCYSYAVWKGIEGPGKILKEMIKEFNNGDNDAKSNPSIGV
jgi:hypothetical protein